MGTVFIGYDRDLDRRAAIKVMNSVVAEDEYLRSRFFQEARLSAKLDHPNIPKIWGFATHENNPYIAMEYIEGEDLKALIEQKAFIAFEQKLGIMIQVCNGLYHAHSKGIIHRDIKPANIRINIRGEAKILDFGLARLDSAEASRAAGPIGSPYYMSPEQWRGRDLDRRTDVFSVGAVLYELISYIRPFQAEDVTAVMTRIVSEPHRPLQEVIPGCPSDLSDLVDRALAKDRNARYSDCLEFAKAIATFRASLPQRRRQLQEQIDQVQAEFAATEKRAMDEGVLDFLGLSLSDQSSSITVGRVGTVDASDFGVMLERQAVLRQQLDSLKQEMKLAVPLLRMFKASRVQFEQGQYDACRQSLQELLTKAPSNAAALRLMEACRLAIEERRSRDEHLARLKVVLDQAQQAMHRGQLSKARELVDKVLQIEPSHSESLALQEAIRGRETSEAAQRKQRMAALLEQCRDGLRSGEFDIAVKASEELLKLAPGQKNASTHLPPGSQGLTEPTDLKE